jgi:hypothetical protein
LHFRHSLEAATVLLTLIQTVRTFKTRIEKLAKKLPDKRLWVNIQAAVQNTRVREKRNGLWVII